eukprot:1157161-Pelagomonas_calceolata.AAC.2
MLSHSPLSLNQYPCYHYYLFSSSVQLQACFQVILSKLLAVAAQVDVIQGAHQSQARGVLGVQLAPS